MDNASCINYISILEDHGEIKVDERLGTRVFGYVWRLLWNDWCLG